MAVGDVHKMVSRYDMKIKEDLNLVLRFKYLFMTSMVYQVIYTM